jgi:SAM-dependent methyltransferase
MATRVLEIGGQPKPQAHLLWPDAEILHLNIDADLKPDIIADAANPPEELNGTFDKVFASHVLEHFSYNMEEHVLRKWIGLLKDGGELHIVVPSAEWAAREVLSDKPSPALLPHMHAGNVNQWDVHLNSFTMRKLRAVFERLGLNVTRAASAPYHIHVWWLGKDLEAEQHYICGVKGAPELSKA